MTGLERALLRLLGVWTVVTGVELLERVAYRAGALDTARAVVDDENRNRHRPLDNPGPGDEPWHCQVCQGPCRDVEDQADDDLVAADLTDVVWAHIITVHGGRGGECAC